MIGFLNVIKPTGVSSGFVVNKIKHLTKHKVGHLGTLDPLASGVLPIAIGKATRFFDYFLNKDKVYFALAKFGVETDTLDPEGKVVACDPKNVSLDELLTVKNKFIGKIMQTPPLYSAKTVGGVRAYQAAIENKEIQLEPRQVNVYDIDIVSWHETNVYAFTIHCSSGTYVRSLIRDFAYELNTVATTVTLEELEESVEDKLLPIEGCVKLPTLNIDLQTAKNLFEGKEVAFEAKTQEYILKFDGQIYSIAECVDNKLKNKIYLCEKECLW